MNPTKSGLTEEQIERLRLRLEGTRLNVYQAVRDLAGREVEDEIFEDLNAAGLFKCEECNVWLPLDEKDPAFFDMCQECAAEM